MIGDVIADDETPQTTHRRLGIVLSSTQSDNDVEGVLNPAIARDRDGKLVMFPRMVARGNVSRIGLARSIGTADAPTFDTPEIVLSPEAPYELRTEAGGYGCEDPRVTFIAHLDAYVMAYSAFGPDGPRIALAISHDAYRWTRLGLIDFDDPALNAKPNKDAAFFPEPVLSPMGVPSFALYHRPMLAESISGQAPIDLVLSLPPERREVLCIAYVPVDDAMRDPRALCNARESLAVLPIAGSWGRFKNGAGTPPVRTANGWLSFFHGVDVIDHATGRTLFYQAGLVLHDLERPHRVLYRSPSPLLDPETREERIGVVNDVVFPTGIDVLGDGNYNVYYGAADARIACARFTVL